MARHPRVRRTRRIRGMVRRHRPAGPPQRSHVDVMPQMEASVLQRALVDPTMVSPAEMLILQRSVGNRAVSGLIQAHTTVGPVGDHYEREAEQVAERVLGDQPTAASGRRAVQRQGSESDELAQREPWVGAITPLVQRLGSDGRGAFEASPRLERRLAARQGAGRPLSRMTRAAMEPRFGADFSDVRLHTDAEADKLIQQLQAKAFTHGRDIYLGAGQYRPETMSGKRLLAHELTHVVQQTSRGPATIQRADNKEGKGEENKVKIKKALEIVVDLKCGEFYAAKTLADKSIPEGIERQMASLSEQGMLFKKISGIYTIEQKKNEAKAIHEKAKSATSEEDKAKVEKEVARFTQDNWELLIRETKKLSSDAAVRIMFKLAYHLIKSIDPATIKKDQELREKQQAWSEQYATLEDDLEKYATRRAEKFRETRSEDLPIIARALADLPRGEGGKLTRKAVGLMEEGLGEQQQIVGYFGTMKRVREEGEVQVKSDLNKTIGDLKKMLLEDRNRNPLTKRTNYPELLNLKNPKTGKTLHEEMPELRGAVGPYEEISRSEDKDVTENMDVSGTSMKITYNKSDVNFPERLSLLKEAVAKIKAAGFTDIPSLDVFMPKTGQALTVHADNTIFPGSKISRNEFVAPKHLHMSSAALGTPLTDVETRTDPRTKETKLVYKFSSTALDPGGVGTLVHEFGHVLHYHTSPGKYHNLHSATFKGDFRALAGQVSGYAHNPREFVAEVFLGAVYGRAFSDEIKEMYHNLGGPSLGELKPQGEGTMLAPPKNG